MSRHSANPYIARVVLPSYSRSLFLVVSVPPWRLSRAITFGYHEDTDLTEGKGKNINNN